MKTFCCGALRFIKIPLIVVLLVISISGSAYPQISDVSFDHIFLEQGLSQSIVKCILQDRNGFMIFGTEDGLNVYDGYSFKVIRKTDDTNSLSYNDISALCEDKYGGLWVGTFNAGVNLYIPDKKKYLHFNYDDSNLNTLSNDNINIIAEDRDGNIWVGTDHGLNRIIITSTEESSFIIKRGVEVSRNKYFLNEGRILSLLCDSRGDLWAGTDNGLFRIAKAGKENFYVINECRNVPSSRNSISSNLVRTVFEDSKGNMWAGTAFGLNKIPKDKLDKNLYEFTGYFHSAADIKSLSNNDIYSICEDDAGMLWIGTNGGGINIYDRNKDSFVTYRYDPLDSRSLSIDEIRSLFKDRSGIIWIGTYGGGINKVSRGTGQFYHYKHRPDDPNSLSHSIIWSFYQDNDNVLWIGTHNGLDRLDRKSNTYKYYFHTPGQNSLSNNVVRVITPSGNGKLLIGTNGGGVDEFDPVTGKFINFSHTSKTNSLIHDEIRAIYKDKEGIVWLGTYGRGMDRYDPRTGSFKHFYNIPDDTTSLSQDYVRVIVEDNSGYLWIGTEGGGLNRFNKKSEKFTRYISVQKSTETISSNYIFSILIDSSGTLWLGTYGGGLNKFNPLSGEIKKYTVSQGLPSNSVYGILQDKSGYLWLSTTNGLSRFHPVEETFKNYNVKDGLQNNEYNGGSYYRTSNGELLFGGINGFNLFNPEDIKNNTYLPPVVLTSFKKFNKEVDFSIPLYSIHEIELNYSENVFSFEFAALDYSSPEKNKYAYKMEGVDQNWVYVDADKRFAAYTTLPPGNYTFYIKGSNSDGVWNDRGIKLLIKIVPPFWQTWWFLSIAAVMVLGTAYLLYMRRLRIIRMKIELQAAHDAQLSIMPLSDPVHQRLEVSGTCIPANEVGGDFFDYFWLDETKFGIMIGDVSGKAMKAAITAVMTSGMIISEMRSHHTINTILENVNASLVNKLEKKMFVSVCICIIDIESRALCLANAGLNRPIILSDSEIKFLFSEGPRLPLGVKRELHYEQTSYILKQNDILILTTDGINEAQNSSRELYGEERLKKHLLSLDTNHLPAVEIKESIIKNVQKFTRKEKPNDDMTALVIRVK